MPINICDSIQMKMLFQIIDAIDSEVYLFGSRVDDSKKGGDIDILLFSKDNRFNLSQKIATEFLLKLDSKLDLVVFDKDNMTIEQQAFVNTLNLERLK